MVSCRALAVAEGELAKAGERMAEYQTANRDLTAQAEESRQQLQVLTLIRCQDCMVLLRCPLDTLHLFPNAAGWFLVAEHWLQFQPLTCLFIMLCWGLPRSACVPMTRALHTHIAQSVHQ